MTKSDVIANFKFNADGQLLRTGKTFAFDPACGWSKFYLGGSHTPYEGQNIDMCKCFSNGGGFVDVGANIGLFSIHIADVATHVHAFEPAPVAHDYLMRNVDLNKTPNIDVHQVALSDTDGHALFAVASTYQYSHLTRGKTRLPTMTVPTRRLDSFELTGIKCIKIDVEGFETAVLRGARETLLANDRPAVMFEHDGNWLKRAGFKRDEAFDILRDLGYKFVNKHWEPFFDHPQNNVYAIAREPDFPHPHPDARRVRSAKSEAMYCDEVQPIAAKVRSS